MTDTPTTDETTTDSISTSYKIRGEDDLPDGAGVLGKNTASSGTPVGVEGTVPNNAGGYGLATPNDAKINGVLDTKSYFGVNIDGNGNLYIGPDAGDGKAGNVVLGHSSNNTAADTLVFADGATIAGGGFNDDSTVEPNTVLDDFGTVSGGQDNQAGSDDGDTTTNTHATVGGGNGNIASGAVSTVGGGENNTASANYSTVCGGVGNTSNGDLSSTIGGGNYNTASGDTSTVCGGLSNTASGTDSTVPGGSYGAAESSSSFVWNDGSGYHAIPDANPDGLSSDTAVNGESVTGSQTFSVSAQGGVRFITGSSSVTYIEAGSTSWSTKSSRTTKTNIDPVDTREVLAGVEELDVATWEYKDDDGEGVGTTHIGPMAEEFHEIVDVGSSDEHINSLNADGVLFAAVQGLSAKVDDQQTELDEKEERIEEHETELDETERQIEELEAENEHLRERLAAIEDHLGLDSAAEPAPADD